MGWSWPSEASPSIVRISLPSAWTASTVHDFTDIRAGQPERLSEEVDEELARLDVGLPPDPVDRASDVPQRATSLAARASAPALRDARHGTRTGLPRCIRFRWPTLIPGRSAE